MFIVVNNSSKAIELEGTKEECETYVYNNCDCHVEELIPWSTYA